MAETQSSTSGGAKNAARSLATAVLVLAARVTSALMTLGYTLLLTRVMTPAEIGATFAALSTGLLTSVFISLNSEAGSIRYLPLYLEKARLGDAAGYVAWCRRVVLVLGGLCALPVAGWLIWRGDGFAILPYGLAIAAAPFLAMARVNARHATALGRILLGTLPRALIRPALLLTVIGVAAANDQTLTAGLIAGLFLIAALLTSALQWLLLRSAMAFQAQASPAFGEARQWLGLGLMLTPALVMNEYLRDLIILVSAWNLPSADVARLGIALSMVGLLSFGVTALDMVFSPQISRATARGERQRRSRLLSLCGAGKIGAMVVGVPLAWLLIPFALDAMGRDYAGLEDLFLILCATPVAKAVFGPASLLLNILGRGRTLFWGTLAGGAGLTAAVVIGSAQGGLIGAAIGVACAMVFYQGLLFAICLKTEGVDTTLFSVLTERNRRRGIG